MSEWKAKRFWKAASAESVDGGFGVFLDGRAVRTPAKAALILPSHALAEALAAEWDAQNEHIVPDTMPLTRLANSAVDKVRVQHAAIADMIAEYGASDLLCYRADGPEALITEQDNAWRPFLSWADTALGITLKLQTGIMPLAQPDTSIQRMSSLTHAEDAFRLTALHDLVSISGSWVLGYAVQTGAFSVEAAWDACIVDEIWQARQWGDDDEALDVRARRKQTFETAKLFCRLSEGEHGNDRR